MNLGRTPGWHPLEVQLPASCRSWVIFASQRLVYKLLELLGLPDREVRVCSALALASFFSSAA